MRKINFKADLIRREFENCFKTHVLQSYKIFCFDVTREHLRLFTRLVALCLRYI